MALSYVFCFMYSAFFICFIYTIYPVYLSFLGGGAQELALRDVAEDVLLKSFIKPIQSI